MSNRREFKRTKRPYGKLHIFGHRRNGGARFTMTSNVFGKLTEVGIELTPADVRALVKTLQRWPKECAR